MSVGSRQIVEVADEYLEIILIWITWLTLSWFPPPSLHPRRESPLGGGGKGCQSRGLHDQLWIMERCLLVIKVLSGVMSFGKLLPHLFLQKNCVLKMHVFGLISFDCNSFLMSILGCCRGNPALCGPLLGNSAFAWPESRPAFAYLIIDCLWPQVCILFMALPPFSSIPLWLSQLLWQTWLIPLLE